MAWGRRPDTISPAAVAGAAARWMVLSKVASDEHTAAFVGPRVVGNQPKAPFALVTKDLELRHEIAHTGFEALGRHHDADAALLVTRREPRFLKIRQQHLADSGRYACGVGEGVGRRSALLVRP